MAHPQLNYSNIHLSQKNTKAEVRKKKKKKKRLIHFIPIRGILLWLFWKHLFWKQNWLAKIFN